MIQSVISYLKAQSAVSDAVGARVFPLKVQSKEAIPAITAQRISDANVHNLKDPSGLTQTRVQLSSYALLPSTRDAIGEAIRGEMDGFTGLMSTEVVRCCTKEFELDDYLITDIGSDAGLYRNIQDYMITHTEDVPPVIVPSPPSGPITAPSFSLGTDFTISPTGIPPDTIGAVGPNSIVVTLNGQALVFDKSGSLISSVSLNAFFGNIHDDGAFDPRVVYDPFSERFFACAADGRADSPVGGEANLLLNVSKTSDPADGWWSFKIDTSEGGTLWLDFPVLGFNQDAVTVGGLMLLKTAGGTTRNYFAYVFPKDDLLDNPASIANMDTVQDLLVPSFNFFALHPHIDLDDAPLPHSMWKWIPGSHITRANVTVNGGGFTVTSIVDIPYIDIQAVGSGRQPTGGNPVITPVDLEYSTSTRIGSYPVKINNRVYIAISGRNIITNTIVVLKIDYLRNEIVAKTILEQADTDLIYPSIAVNSEGEIVVGCTATSGTLFPSAAVFVGQDAGSVFEFSDMTIVKEGTGPFERLTPTRNRWGDYSAVVVDPSNSKRMWSFQMWSELQSGNQGDRIQVTEIIID